MHFVRPRLTVPSAFAVALVTPAVVFAGLYALRLTLPRQALEATEAELARLRGELALLSGFASGEQAQDTTQILEDEAAKIERRVPIGRRDAEIIDSLEKLSIENRFEEFSARVEGGMVLAGHAPPVGPRAPIWMLEADAAEKLIHPYVITLSFHAGWKQLTAFVDSVGRLAPFLALETLSGSRGVPVARYTLSLRAYYR